MSVTPSLAPTLDAMSLGVKKVCQMVLDSRTCAGSVGGHCGVNTSGPCGLEAKGAMLG